MTALYGAIETGGTKCICIVAGSPTQILAETRIPTGDPQDTTAAIADFFLRYMLDSGQKIERVGLASFGPLDLEPSSPTFGQILATPKLPWKGWNLLANMEKALNLPVFLDTDVNAAALGEHLWGAAQGLTSFIYLTIGTGIGGGGMIGSRLIHGLMHPEMGHILVPHDRSVDPFSGVCPFHGNCLEGLASGPALEKRTGTTASHLPPDHPAWDLEVQYIAAGIHSLICALSPQRIILGGGVMQQQFLFDRIRLKVRDSLAGYISSPQILEGMDEYIVPAALGRQAGALGALALAVSGLGVTRRDG